MMADRINMPHSQVSVLELRYTRFEGEVRGCPVLLNLIVPEKHHNMMVVVKPCLGAFSVVAVVIYNCLSQDKSNELYERLRMLPKGAAPPTPRR